MVMNGGAPGSCSNLRTLQLPPGGRGPGAPPERASTCWPLAPPTAWTSPASPTRNPPLTGSLAVRGLRQQQQQQQTDTCEERTARGPAPASPRLGARGKGR